MDGVQPTLQQELSGSVVLEIENRLARQFPNKNKQQQESSGINYKEGQSIYIEKGETGRCLYYWLNAKSKWQYVAYMKNWLGFNIKSYLEYLMQNQALILGYYDDNAQTYLNQKTDTEMGHFLQSLMIGSCFLVFAILLFQNIRNGTAILKGSGTGDDRSQQFSYLFREITKEKMEIKIKALRLKLQIPWLAVEAVISNSNLRDVLSDTNVDRLAVSFLDDVYPRVMKSNVNDGGPQCPGGIKHLLHIFHETRTPKEKWLARTQSEHAQVPTKRFADFYIPSATQLRGSSTGFNKLGGGTDVIYDNKKISLSGLMQITPLHLFTYSREIFEQLILFEQTYLECGLPVTVYLACMIRLLQTEEDVKLMQKKGIVQNTLNGEKEALYFVQDMSEYLSKKIRARVPNGLGTLSDQVMEHHEKLISRELSDIKSQFCPSKWVIFSIIGAIGLFVLTALQTVYTMLGYKNI